MSLIFPSHQLVNAARGIPCCISNGRIWETSKLAQFVDDVLDFTGSASVLGKPALNDIRSGLATAPVLYAAEEFPQLSPMILRKFRLEGDVETAQRLVFESRGIERTRQLAADHAQLAVEAVPCFHICHISNECAMEERRSQSLRECSIIKNCLRCAPWTDARCMHLADRADAAGAERSRERM